MQHVVRSHPRLLRVALPILVVFAACTGSIGAGDGDMPGDGQSQPGAMHSNASTPVPGGLPGAELGLPGGVRRLTNEEYENSLRDLLGDTTPATGLPQAGYAFYKEYTPPDVSATLIEGVELLARDASARLMADTARRDRVVGCKPASADDLACVKGFVARFGRRALRRALADDEVQRYIDLYKTAAQMDTAPNPYTGIDAVVRVFLQQPEFMFRVEVGAPVAGLRGVYKLTQWELASRLSFLAWGSGPDDALLDLAQAGKLGTPADVRVAAEAMLANPRARDRIARFHALWLGYDRLPHPPDIAAAMRAETDALIGRVIFEQKRPWQDLLRSQDTYVSDLLAKHYGLTPPGSATPTWVPYGQSGRRGLLSHGSFLVIGAKFDDTSPTVRGKLVRERLFCEEIPDPPAALMVNTDEPPAGVDSPCKWDRYAAQRSMSPVCAGCHEKMDLVGFGLENYDALGRFRTYDVDRQTGKSVTSCRIKGDGEMIGVGKFNGPAGLADLALEQNDRMNACVATELYRFSSGRFAFDGQDQKVVDALASRLGGKDFRFDQLLLDLVSSNAFAHRRDVD